MARALTTEENEQFDVIISGHPGVALLNTELGDGTDVAVIIATVQEDDGNITMIPLAVLLTDELIARFGIQPPTDAALTCRYCRVPVTQDGNGVWVDGTGGDGCPGDDSLTNENQPHAVQ